MAATIQTPAHQPPTATNNNTSPATPQLKRIVYSKYRELLGSYNDKANAIIESLPAYMVKEDRGFHFDPQIIDEVDNVVYGTPPAPPPLSTGAVPTQRLPTQMPQFEAPACVQNAMMTKDKKPFTYTPGGIDLSQIKSQRMAKRLARNAQIEGATGQQQMNRPTSSPQQSNGGASPASHLGATAMGMPFQVLPTGPPPPPPQPGKASQPPPPPPVPQSNLAPQSNGNAAHARKSPTPQNFEPPPMGFRPEIKIPPNPMAALKKVPPPQEKNNFWVEEYRKERSKSPLVGNDENDNTRSSPNKPQPETNQYTYSNCNNNNQQNEYQPQSTQNRSPSPQPMRSQQDYTTKRAVSPSRAAAQQRLNESQYQTQYTPQPQAHSIQRPTSQYQYQAAQSSPQQQPQQYQPQSPQAQRQQIASPQKNQGPTPPQYQQQQQTSATQQPPQQQQSVPWRSQRQVASGIQNNVSQPRDVMSPAPAEMSRPQPQQQQQEQQQQYPAYLRSRDVRSPAAELQPAHMSQPYQQKNSQVGSIYIPPVGNQQPQQQSLAYQEPQGVRQQQTSRQVPANRWVSAQTPSAEPQSLNRIKSPPPPSSNGFGTSNNTGLRLQINNTTSNSNVKERIIPIQLEHTPTPTRTPSAPGFGPQPFYNANQQQYSSVPSPPMAQGATSNGQNSPSYIVRSPNQFVDQGYNNYPASQDPNRVTSPTSQQMQSPRIVQQTNTAGGVRTRIIPIALESSPDGPLNPNNVRGPISQQPLVIQNDPRNQNTWGSGSVTPTQSKSFRILQQITDTTGDGNAESKPVEADLGDQEPQLQRPTYARQMGPGQMNSPTIEQMKRMQLNNEQAFANRTRNQENDDEKERVDKKSIEDPRYRGPSNPSKTFKKLQSAIERCPPTSTEDKNGASPVMKQPQPNRYVNQKPVYSPDEQSQQYVHPSEQQTPEPKIYTGSAIPSRSFKILQAMTTPENAAEKEGSDVVVSNKSITECPCQHPIPPPCMCSRPFLPPCCTPPPLPPSSSGGDVHNNWQYPSPHHHPHHPCSPCPYYYYYYPPSEYDSQNCSPCQFSRGGSQPQDLPNIIITPSVEEVPQVVRDTNRDRREGSVIETLSRKLNEIIKPVDLDLNMSNEDDKKYVGDGGKKFGNSPSPIKSECENNKVSIDDSSDDLLTSSSDPTTTSSFEDCGEHYTHDGLQAIKSVTNIQVYNKRAVSPMDGFDDDLTVADGESIVFDEECEEEEEEGEEIIGEELEYDEEAVLIEEADSVDGYEIEEIDDDEEEEDEVIVMDDLSVIYEENEADIFSPRPRSRISSSVSDTTTLANGECEEEELPKEDEDDDDNSNSVTVRLPLKFSFSRSSNDENIATVEVGNSQIEDKRRSFSIASVNPDDYESDHECDVSVTISLSPSGGSFDRKSSLSPVPRRFEPFSIVEEDAKHEDVFDFEEEDVSVSFSLPVKNKSFNQMPNEDITETVALKKKKIDSLHNGNSAIEAWRRSNNEISDNNDDIWSSDLQDQIESKEDFKPVKTFNQSKKESSPKREEQAETGEEVDFWATLQATRKEAQLFLEKTADFWGKKIDGREKANAQVEEAPLAMQDRKDSQTEEDFWATIRVKDSSVEPAKEPEEIETKSTTKSGKPKKKKKIVKAAVKETEPEHVWSTVKLPNANNRAKIVESTIKMIQDKAKPKEVAKPVSKEIVVGDLVASITGTYDKEKPAEVLKESNIKASGSKIKMQKSVSSEISEEPKSALKTEKVDIRSKLVKEKAELKTQIMNQMFAKAFVIPDKPLAMRGVLSEIEPQTVSPKTLVTSKVEEKLSSRTITENSEQTTNMAKEKSVTDEVEKVEKPKKKVSKSKKETEDGDSDMLNTPKVKKSSKDSKKLKKKKQENQVSEQLNEVTAVVKNVIEPEISVVEEKTDATKNEMEDTDFWSQIESSKSNYQGNEDTTKCSDFWAKDKAVCEPSNSVQNNLDNDEETDFWAVIESSKAANDTPPKSSYSCVQVEASETNQTECNYDTIVKKPREIEDHAEVIDIWADMESKKTKKTHKKSTDKRSSEKEAKSTLDKADELQPDFIDIWADIETTKAKRIKTSSSLNASSVGSTKDTIESKEEERSKIETCREEELVTEESGVWSKPFMHKPKATQITDIQDNYKVDIIELESPINSNNSQDTDETKSSKPKNKKKIKKTLSDADIEVEAESPKLKTKKKSSKHRKESAYIESELFVETVEPQSKNYALDDPTVETAFENDAELTESKPRKNYSRLQEDSTAVDLNSSGTLKSKKKKHSHEEVPKDSAELVTTKSKKKSSKLQEDSMEMDSPPSEVLKPKTKKHVQEEQSTEIEIEYGAKQVKPKTKKKSSRKEEDAAEIDSRSVESLEPRKMKYALEEQLAGKDIGYEVEIVKSKSKKKISKPREDLTEIEPKPVSETPKPKKKSAALEELLSKYNIGKNVESFEPKNKKKHSSKYEPIETTDAVKSKSKKKNLLLQKEESETTDFWAEIEVSKAKISKKSKKSSTLQLYGDKDVELIYVNPVPTYYAIFSTPEKEMSLWAAISYAEDPVQNVIKDKRTDFFASNSSGNDAEVSSEVDTAKIDFWVTQRKFETNGGFVKEASPKKEEESEEVDFWAEIKGPNEDEDELQTVFSKDECEARRNNYKKAMAFFTNTVKVEKKESTPAPSRNLETPKNYKDQTPEPESYSPWSWKESVEYDWETPVQREVNDVLLIVDDNETEDEPDTLIENNPYEKEEPCDFEAIEEEQCEEEDVRSESSESITDSTPNHFQIERQFPKLNTDYTKPKEKSIEPISNKISEEIKISVKDRIFAFETGSIETPAVKPKPSLIVDSATPKSNLSRNSSQRSESEIEEDDSGVTDMNKPLSETDTESESFPELRKMTRYQRASTHSRLFKLLQDDCDLIEEEQRAEEKAPQPECNLHPRKKIVHNVSITRKQNPKALQDAESMSQRRERLSLPLRKNISIDADNLSSPNSPASPIFGQASQAISDQLVNELVQSLLLKNSSSNLKNLPMEKLQAAAKRVLEEELDSLENTSLDSTPALTPQEFKSESYSDYYDTWNAKNDSDLPANGSFEILPSKAFKALQESTATAKRRPWSVRCPRVLSSKTVNRDLARVTESPEILSRSSRSPEIVFGERASSVGRWRKV